MGTWLTVVTGTGGNGGKNRRGTWAAVIRTAHTRRRLEWLTAHNLFWLVVYTVVGSAVAVAFIEGDMVMQRQIRIGGTVAACKCGKQPKHYEERNMHFVECYPCFNRTPHYPTFNEALAAWERQETAAIAQRPA